ncbi:MAG TPA: hypothetical protein VEU74_13010 [Gemmatimonadales bacterium]|nr:hypothetical protein [Gemmatimonadales bacterium]
MIRPHARPLGPVLLSVVLLSGHAPARRAWRLPGVQREWVPLGARQIDLRTDHDILRTAREEHVKRVRLVVEGNDLELFDVRFTFGDGATFSPATRFLFKGNARSHVIALPGAARVVRWIDFFYRNVSGGAQGKATVRLYGRR